MGKATDLVADNGLQLLVVQGWDCEPALVLRVDREVDIPQVREPRMQRVWGGILPWHILIWGDEAPAWEALDLSSRFGNRRTFVSHVPMHRCKRDDIFESFELPSDHSPVC